MVSQGHQREWQTARFGADRQLQMTLGRFGDVRAMIGGMKRRDNEGIETYSVVPTHRDRGLGPGSAGQSGDNQGLSEEAEAGSESVEELIEEGQYFEAGLVNGIENAPDADVSEIHTRQVPTEDIPDEYLDDDKPSTR